MLSSSTSVIRSSHRVSLIDPDGSRRQQSAFYFVPSLVIIFFTPNKWTALALRLISWLLVTFKSIEMFRVEGISSYRKGPPSVPLLDSCIHENTVIFNSEVANLYWGLLFAASFKVEMLA